MPKIVKTIAPGDIREIPGWEGLELLQAMMAKNDFASLPMYVIENSGRVIAVAVIDPDYYPLYAKVWCLEVAKDFRGKGYGKWLLTEVLRDFDEVKLCAMRDAFGFYRSVGFRFTEDPDPKSNVGYMVSQT